MNRLMCWWSTGMAVSCWGLVLSAFLMDRDTTTIVLRLIAATVWTVIAILWWWRWNASHR